MEARTAGYTGTVELNDDEGSIAVLDISRAVLCGIECRVAGDHHSPGSRRRSRRARPGGRAVAVRRGAACA